MTFTNAEISTFSHQKHSSCKRVFRTYYDNHLGGVFFPIDIAKVVVCHEVVLDTVVMEVVVVAFLRSFSVRTWKRIKSVPVSLLMTLKIFSP